MKAQELSMLVKRCRKNLEAAEQSAHDRKEMNEALYEALQDVFRIWRKSINATNARARVFKEFEIEELRSGTNPFNRFVRLCMPGRKTNDYNRYASALSYFEEQGWSSAKVGKQLRAHPLTYFSDRGRKRQNKAPRKRTASSDKRVELAKRSLSKQAPISHLDMTDENLYPVQEGWAVFIAKIPSDPNDKDISVIASVNVKPDLLDQIFVAHANQERLLLKARQKKT